MKTEFELAGFYELNQLEAGCDEAGRGCLAGPVVASAVILPPDFKHPWLNDSKQLTEKKRQILRPIIEQEAIAWAVSYIDHEKIDQINILNASILAMHEAVDQLKVKPDFLLIDGNRFKNHAIPHQCFIKGDGRFKSIAAASILAKTHRDEFMEILDKDYPEYRWSKNKGYPTEDHRNAIKTHGFSPFHRLTFAVKDVNQMSLEL
jgi:ribonuclease HII